MKVERWASPKSWLSLIQLFHTFSPSLNPQPTTTQLIPRIGWKSEVQNSKSLSSPISQPKFKNHKDFFNGKSSSDAQENHFLVPPSSSSSCTWTAGGSRLVPHHWSGFSWQDGCYQEMLPILTYLNLEPKWRFHKMGGTPRSSICRWDFPWQKPSSYWEPPCSGPPKNNYCQWIGVREIRNQKPSIFPWRSWGVSCKLSRENQSID